MLLAALFALGLAIGVVIAVGILLLGQLRGIVRNQTGVEDWVREKADFRHKSKGGASRSCLRLIIFCRDKVHLAI